MVNIKQSPKMITSLQHVRDVLCDWPSEGGSSSLGACTGTTKGKTITWTELQWQATPRKVHVLARVKPAKFVDKSWTLWLNKDCCQSFNTERKEIGVLLFISSTTTNTNWVRLGKFGSFSFCSFFLMLSSFPAWCYRLNDATVLQNNWKIYLNDNLR